MATKQLFVNNRKAVREVFGKSDKDVLEDIETIRNWVKTQPHLPEVPSDNMIEIFLSANKFNIEEAKQRLDMYYTIRSLIPQFYENSHPLSPEMVNVPDEMGTFVSLPKQTKDYYKVSILKVNKSGELNPFKYFANLLNILEMKIQHDAAVGDVYVIDYDGITMNHVEKLTPVYVKSAATVLEKVFSNGIKSIHLINLPPFIDALLLSFKTGFKSELFAKIHAHNQLEELYDHIPREILPKEYGGEEVSVQELGELWKECLKENSERFDKLDQMRVNEELRPTPLEKEDVLGYHGNFQKLEGTLRVRSTGRVLMEAPTSTDKFETRDKFEERQTLNRQRKQQKLKTATEAASGDLGKPASTPIHLQAPRNADVKKVKR